MKYSSYFLFVFVVSCCSLRMPYYLNHKMHWTTRNTVANLGKKYFTRTHLMLKFTNTTQ